MHSTFAAIFRFSVPLYKAQFKVLLQEGAKYGERSFATCPILQATPIKKPTAGIPTSSARTGIEVETDPVKLTEYCCGANIYKEGSDPKLKPDSEYPDWLWELDLEPNTRRIEDLDKDTFKYWRKVRKAHIRHQNAMSKLRFK